METRKYKTPQRQLDAVRVYREFRHPLSIFLSEEDVVHLDQLCEYGSTAEGSSRQAIVVALIKGEHITSHVEADSVTFLGRLFGLLKLAAKTHPGVEVDQTIDLTRRLAVLVVKKTIDRENSFPADGKSQGGNRRLSFCIPAPAYARLRRDAQGSLSGHVRALVRNKTLLSRISAADVEAIRQSGLLLRAAIGGGREDTVFAIHATHSALKRILSEVSR